MGEDLSTAYKIAAGACIMAFILSIGLSLMMIGRNFWNKTADQVTTSVTSICTHTLHCNPPNASCA